MKTERIMQFIACCVPYRPWRKKIRNFHPKIVFDRYVRRKKYKTNVHNIPIFIISFNRLECLQLLINRLEMMGYTNLHIVDNASTYPPLLEYLKAINYPVHFLSENLGHLAFWKDKRFHKIVQTSFYVVTDPDVIPVDDCPDDFLDVFYKILCAYPAFTKVGFSLKIDDLPEHYPLRDVVLEWEEQFYEQKLSTYPYTLYKSGIDTTFALYGPQATSPVDHQFYESIRVGFPYQARHLPWYKDSSLPTEEDLFYLKTCNKNVTTWSGAVDSGSIKARYGL